MIRECNEASSIAPVVVPPKGRGKAVLFQRRNDEWVELADLEGQSSIRIGRSSSNDVVITDQTCSKRHCEIYRENGRWILRDLKSYNGTFWQGDRVTDSIPLRSHNRIRMGKQELLFVVELAEDQNSDEEIFENSGGERPAGRDTLELPSDTVIKSLFERVIAIALNSESAVMGQSQYDVAIAHLFKSARMAVNPRFEGLNSLWRAIFFDSAIDLLQSARHEEESVCFDYPVVVNADFHELTAIANLTDQQIEMSLWDALRNKIRSCPTASVRQIVLRKMCGQSPSKISQELGQTTEQVEQQLNETSRAWTNRENLY